MPVGRQEGQRRGLAHDHPAGELIGRRLQKAAILLEERSRVVQRMHHQAGQDLRSKLVKLELEGGDYSKIAAPAAERPKQVRILRRAGPHQMALGGDDVGRKEIVDRQTEFARDPAKAAAERQPRNAGGRIDPGGQRQAEGLCLLVEVRQRGPRLDPGSPRRWIDPHRLHLRQVDHDTAVADRAAGDVVAAASHRDEQSVVAGEPDGAHHICRPQAADDEAGFAVDHRVPDGSRLVIPWRTLLKYFAAQRPFQIADRAGIDGLRAGVQGLELYIGHARSSPLSIDLEFYHGPARDHISPVSAGSSDLRDMQPALAPLRKKKIHHRGTERHRGNESSHHLRPSCPGRPTAEPGHHGKNLRRRARCSTPLC